MAPTILYVEDNFENQLLVRRVLESHGYNIVVADDGLSGVKMAQEIRPDLVLMDINIPGMDGYAAATRIKSIEGLRTVPVVALTANVLHGDRERALAAGCDGYLQKPVDIDELRRSVDEFLHGRREQISGQQRLEYVEAYASRLVSDLEQRIAELQSANEELRQLDRLKSEFISTVSHELRTPLNVIIGHGEVLADELFGPLNDHQRRYISNIVRSGRHLHALVQDLLDLGRIESGRLVLNPTHFELAPLLDEIGGLFNPLADERHVSLAIESEGAVATIYADRLRFKQILQNLVGNAVKFTPEQGRVCCRVTRASLSTIRVEVRDTGIGIAPEHHGVIFERFRQVDASSTRAVEGTGLGLALTREFVAAHRGTITVESRPGEGSTFIVEIPQNETALQ